MTCPTYMHEPVDGMPKLCPDSWEAGDIRFLSKCAICGDEISVDITTHWDTREWISENE